MVHFVGPIIDNVEKVVKIVEYPAEKLEEFIEEYEKDRVVKIFEEHRQVLIDQFGALSPGKDREEILRILHKDSFSFDDVKKIHYSRNLLLDKSFCPINPADIDPTKHIRAHDSENAFHGEGNLKYRSSDGHQECIVTPSPWGVYEVVEDPRYEASYNFGVDYSLHGELDVLPWILLGNSDLDYSTRSQRVNLVAKSVAPWLNHLIISPLQPWITEDVKAPFDEVFHVVSPLVLDLNGDGVQLANLNGHGVYFDIDNDGFREASGWVTPEDGLLVLDRNGNGRIDNITELFGNRQNDGFAALRGLDSNFDNAINVNDAQWSSLRVWRDIDSDGVTDDGELFTLDQLGITSISLNSVKVSLSDEGNSITDRSTFVINDVEHEIVDAWFVYDNTNTVPEGNPSITLDVRTLFLPHLRGYGNIEPLVLAMSSDPVLLGQVTVLDQASRGNLLSSGFDLAGKLEALLYRWGDFNAIAPFSRGGNTDARALAFMEKMLDRDFVQAGGHVSDPRPVAGAMMRDAWNAVFNNMSARLLLQTELGNLIVNSGYDPVSDSFDTGSNPELDLTLLADIKSMIASLPTGDRLAAWMHVVRMVAYTVGTEEIPSSHQAALDAAISATLPGQKLAMVKALLLEPPINAVSGTSENDLLSGTASTDFLRGYNGNDTLNGLGGNDQLEAGNGNDILNGGAGDDALVGDSGSDTYVYTSGFDMIQETYKSLSSTEVDRIQMPAGITLANLFLRDVDGDLMIDIRNASGAVTGNIDVLGFFDGNWLKEITFADNSKLDLLTLITPQIGTSGDDSLRGLDRVYYPLDILAGDNGNDTLDGGQGDDILVGGAGNDRFITGYGTDIVQDSRGTDTVVLSFPTGVFAAANLAFKNEDGGDLGIYYSGERLVVLVDQLTSATNAIEWLEIRGVGDSLVDSVAISTIVVDQIGTTGRDTISGYSTGVSINNRLFGLEGNDVLRGYKGKDFLDGGAGDDLLAGGDDDDTYEIDIHSGKDVITETNTTGNDTIQFGAGLLRTSMQLERSRTFDLSIRFAGQEVARIDKFLATSGQVTVETLRFADGATLDLAQFAGVLGTNGNDVLNGADNALLPGDVLDGGRGNDSISGGSGDDNLLGNTGLDTLNGGIGDDLLVGEGDSDTYLINANTGSDIIDDSSGTEDTVKFGAGIPANSINLQRFVSASDELAILQGDTLLVTVKHQFSNGVELMHFADGTAVDLRTARIDMIGTPGNDTLRGINNLSNVDFLQGGAGHDVLYGYRGNDTLDGGAGNDYLDGGAGNDTYVFGVGSGKDTISAYDRTVGKLDVVQLGKGVLTTNLQASRDGTALMLSINGTADSLRINSYFSDDATGGYQVEQIKFADGTIWDVATIKSKVLAGTVENDVRYGYATDDSLSGGTGDDTLYGAAGNDTLSGGIGIDRLYGDSGDDVLIGGTGKDTLVGGNGNDLFRFDALSEMGTDSTTWDVIIDFARGDDKIDLSNLDANTLTTTNDAFNDTLVTTFTAAGQLKLVSGVLYGNTDANYATAEFAIKLNGITALGASDFLL
ncbi:MAG: hypothetical protein J5X22_21645 [Candidatus Accumulibacter sp.]|nr:hypothetical protein [Accumulibacter sp.]